MWTAWLLTCYITIWSAWLLTCCAFIWTAWLFTPAVPFAQRGNEFAALLYYERANYHSDVLVCWHTSLIGTICRAVPLMHPCVCDSFHLLAAVNNISFRLLPFIGVYFRLDLEFWRHLPRTPTPSTLPIHWCLSQTWFRSSKAYLELLF